MVIFKRPNVIFSSRSDEACPEGKSNESAKPHTRNPGHLSTRGAKSEFPQAAEHVEAPTTMLPHPGDGHFQEAECDLVVEIK